MSKCVKCNVTIKDNTDKCPLCKHVLMKDALGDDAALPAEGGGDDFGNMYPNAILVTKRFRFLENLFLFLSLVAAAVVCFVNFVLFPGVMWSLVAVLVLLYGNIVLRLALVGRSGYMVKTVSLTFLAVIILLGIDYLTGYHRWSLDYMLPIGILAIDLMILVLTLVNRRNWQSYLMPQIFMVIVSLVPLILLLTGVIHFPYLVWISLGVSVFLFLGTLILGDQRARTELKRRFHV